MKYLFAIVFLSVISVGCTTNTTKKNKLPIQFTLAEFMPSEGLILYRVEGSSKEVYLHSKAQLTNKHLSSAKVIESSFGNSIEITFTEEGAKTFSDLTAQNIGKPLAIVIDGKVILAPVIRARIEGGKASISGNYSKIEAHAIAAGIMGE